MTAAGGEGDKEVAANDGEGLEEDEDEVEERVGSWKHLTRAEKGSYVMNDALMEELEMAPSLPPGTKSLYDLRTAAPFVDEADLGPLELLQQMCKENPEFKAALLADEEPTPPPYPGARPILRWTLRTVIAAGPSHHPANKKAKLQVYLRDLQEQKGLSEEALQHIARIAGPRYKPANGELTLTSERYEHREDNRRYLMKVLKDLMQEGQRAFPSPDYKLSPGEEPMEQWMQQHQQQQPPAP